MGLNILVLVWGGEVSPKEANLGLRASFVGSFLAVQLLHRHAKIFPNCDGPTRFLCSSSAARKKGVDNLAHRGKNNANYIGGCCDGGSCQICTTTAELLLRENESF